MSDVPDLEKIKPPAEPPADQPDPKTAAEAQELKKKSPSPVEREAEARRSHVASLDEHIQYHKGECAQLRADTVILRGELANERQETKRLSISCAVLQTSSIAVGCMITLGTFLTVLGGILLGVAGGSSGLTDTVKMFLAGSGASLGGCGAVLVTASYAVSWWTITRKAP